MSKLILGLAATTALAVSSAAGAAIDIHGSGTTTGSTITVNPPDNVSIPNTVTFNTTSSLPGTYTSYIDFSNTQWGFYNFSLITSTLGATITLEQLLGDGATTTIQEVTGTGSSLSLLTSTLMPDVTYRFTYTSNFPPCAASDTSCTGGGATSGNASFYVQNAPALPEPASWALMIVGFMGVGVAMRRRRRPALAQLA